MPKSERQKIETIVLDWAKAVSAGDRDGILARHAPDVLMFDFPDTDVAFITCEMHCDGTSAGPLDFHLTVGFERQGGEWVITHEHHSVPTVEGRFIEQEANG